MEQEWLVQGRRVRAAEVALISPWLQARPSWNPTRLARELCQHDRAAGWPRVGATTGRTRPHDRSHLPGPPKEVFLQPLRAGWKERLAA